MASRLYYQSQLHLKALNTAFFVGLLLAMPASVKAEDETGTEVEAEQQRTLSLVDREQIGNNIALEEPGGVALRGVPLVLSVTVNGTSHGLAQFRLIDNDLWATSTVLEKLGLRYEPASGTSILRAGSSDLLMLEQALPGDISYNGALQTLTIMVEASRLAVATSLLNLNRQEDPVAASSTGLLINYDLLANWIGSDVTLNGFSQARLFSGNAVLENTTLVSVSTASDRGNREFVRLDTSLAFSIPDKRLTVRAGDIITRSASFSRPTRIGGLRIGTDFALQPYLITSPIPSFFGEATLPSSVDLYIDGIRRFSGEVAPGPFEVGSGANRINGAGNAQVVVTDALGQVTSLDFPIYDTPRLLAKGLTDWSIETGYLRESFGISSFDYGNDLVATASIRSGLSETLTLEAHGEVGKDLYNGGVGLAWLSPIGGVASGSLALSENDGNTGHRFELGYSWINSDFNLSATYQQASDDFADIAALDGAFIPTQRILVNVGFSSANWGSFAASFIRQRDVDEPMSSFASVNWHKSLAEKLSLTFTAQQNLENRRERGAFLTLNLSLGRGENASASLQTNERRTSGSVGYRRTPSFGGGTGWAVNAGYDGDFVQGAAQIDHLTSNGQITAGVRHARSTTRAFAGYSGALVVMGDGIHASRKIVDGFALVDTNGLADVPVRLHNREIGRTNGAGQLLITGLNSYQNNKVSIDPTDLPLDFSVSQIVRNAVPSRNAGVRVNFDIKPSRSVLVTLIDEHGAELPVGLPAWMDGAQENQLFVGYGGQLFIEDAKAGARVLVEQEWGTCAFELPEILPTASASRLDTIVCRRVQWANSAP